ncbi:amino acid transporter [Trichoderma longibrachiatum]|uniref:Pote amino acid transporter n=1 Tax=Trichoderma longibrachiatum ATCC 18648 TaxID=983965 RepID=A0A2T4C4W6_TRILO|nr:pote amino acid transporter [Trichoderma longibrachiatum ATCC 18648]
MAPPNSCEDLKAVVSEREDGHHVVEKLIDHDPILANAADAQQLASIGYKQELQRHYSSIQVFAIAFSIMGLLPSISATLWFSVPAGPIGMVWGWFSASAFIFIVGLAIADLGSSLPTSGGLYWWTHYFAADRYKNPLSFLVGYSNTIGLIGGICSIDYGFASFIVSLGTISNDGEWAPSRGHLYAIFVATVLCHGVLATSAGRIMHHLQTWFVIANFALIVATIIALPVSMRVRNIPINSASYVFGHAINETAWPSGWAFMLSWLSPIWTIGAFDSCVHMSEEAKDPTKAVPIGILASIGGCWIFGFLVTAVLAACAGSDFDDILRTPFGQPIAQIYYNALGKGGALGFMSAISILQFFMGLSIVVAASRQTWAFSRDGALPFSAFLREISTRFGYQPLRTVWATCITAIVIGLLSLINNAAANALFSVAAAGNNVAWAIPIMCRVVWGRGKFRPGPFYTGRFSVAIAVAALLYLTFSTILCMFPTEGPEPDPSVMNYSAVVNGTVWGGALLYYFCYAHKWFTGPRHTLDEAESEGDTM